MVTLSAERTGFEPVEELNAPHRFSKPALSAAQPPLQVGSGWARRARASLPGPIAFGTRPHSRDGFAFGNGHSASYFVADQPSRARRGPYGFWRLGSGKALFGPSDLRRDALPTVPI